jgi:UPF0755 protein
MKLALYAISLLLAVFMVSATGIFFWGHQQYTKAGMLENDTMFVVEKGDNVSHIADRLIKARIINDPLLFKIAAKITGHHTSIKAGEYQIGAKTSMQKLLSQLVAGNVYQHKFTVPEGLTSWQIVELLKNVEGLENNITDIPPEGSMLPETYNYVRSDKAQDKILRMQKSLKEVMHNLWMSDDNTVPNLSPKEIIILASIVEKETAVDSERKRIAGVFHNRLSKEMKLQSDPTVIYAITKGKIQNKGKGPLGRRLLRKDLEFDSPYNTYMYQGLPPGPIANPGRASIEAVFSPEHHDYLYFVADGTGAHVFSKTLEEHNRNVARWRRIRKNQGN